MCVCVCVRVCVCVCVCMCACVCVYFSFQFYWLGSRYFLQRKWQLVYALAVLVSMIDLIVSTSLRCSGSAVSHLLVATFGAMHFLLQLYTVKMSADATLVTTNSSLAHTSRGRFLNVRHASSTCILLLCGNEEEKKWLVGGLTCYPIHHTTTTLRSWLLYRNCPRCGDGDVSAEFGSAKSAMWWWCGVLDSIMAGSSLLLLLNFKWANMLFQ